MISVHYEQFVSGILHEYDRGFLKGGSEVAPVFFINPTRYGREALTIRFSCYRTCSNVPQGSMPEWQLYLQPRSTSGYTAVLISVFQQVRTAVENTAVVDGIASKSLVPQAVAALRRVNASRALLPA